jgi:hypothetical protein
MAQSRRLLPSGFEDEPVETIFRVMLRTSASGKIRIETFQSDLATF